MSDTDQSLFVRLLATRRFRALLAAVFVAAHLGAFALAGRALGVPFNTKPGEPPHYVDIHSNSLKRGEREPTHWSRLVYSRWDAQHYLSFAIRGFEGCPRQRATPENIREFLACGLAWLPAYGLLGGMTSRWLLVDADYALIIISAISAWTLMYLWTTGAMVRKLGPQATLGSVIALNAFPSAFYLVAPYAESITLATAFAGFVALCSDSWLIAAILIGAASAFRIAAVCFAIGFGCAAAAAALTERAEGTRTWWRKLCYVPLTVWGLVATMSYYGARYGDPLLYNHVRRAFGDRPVFGRLVSPDFYVRGLGAMHYDIVMLLALVGFVATFGRSLLRRFRLEERIFLVVSAAVGIVVPIMNASDYWGLNRYMLLSPMAFLCVGLLLTKSRPLFASWIAFCGFMYWRVELCSFVSHGSRGACPTLGAVGGRDFRPLTRPLSTAATRTP